MKNIMVVSCFFVFAGMSFLLYFPNALFVPVAKTASLKASSRLFDILSLPQDMRSDQLR